MRPKDGGGAGFKITKSIALASDLHMEKLAFHTDIGKGQGVMDYISEQEVKSAKELIEKAILQD